MVGASKSDKNLETNQLRLNSLLTEKCFCVFIWLMRKLFSKPSLRAFSGLSVNLSAAWFAAAFITPNFADVRTPAALVVLMLDLLFGTVSLAVVIRLEELLE